MKPKFLATIAVAQGLILAALLANSLGMFDFLPDFQLFGCSGEIYAAAQSPDKKLTAFAFERNCGATTASTTFLILRDSREKLDLTQNLIEEEVVFVARGIYEPKLKWLNKNRLQVTFSQYEPPKIEDVHLQVVKRGDVAIEYRGLK